MLLNRRYTLLKNIYVLRLVSKFEISFMSRFNITFDNNYKSSY